LFDRNLGEDARRILEVHARFGQQRGHLLFTGDDGAKAVIGGCELAFNQCERAIGAGAGVRIRIFRPWANYLQGEKTGVNLPEHDLTVGSRDLIKWGRWDSSDALFEFLKGRDFGIDALAREVL